MPKPTVGRAVHVVPTKTLPGEKKDAHWAATVSEVTGEGLTLFVMHPSVPDFFLRGVQEDQSGAKPGTWHWPEREE
jgi:hypothetical protein